MRAVEINQYGSTDVLCFNESAPTPEPGPNDILVRNKATSVNPVDLLKRDGYGWPVFEKKRQVKFPWILGNDCSGVVEKLGSGVTGFNVGDEVFSAPNVLRQGTWAEYTVISQSEAALKPANISFTEAGTIPYVALTSWSALAGSARLNQKKPEGKKVLVHAGSGGIGTFAIQLLKAWGYYVATTCSTRNIDLVTSLGADHVIDYSKEDFSQVLSDYDVVFDTLGSKVASNEEKSLSILKKSDNAVYVSIVHPIIPMITANGLILGSLKAAFTLIGKKIKNRGTDFHWAVFKPNGLALEEIKQYIEDGKIKPVIDRTFDLFQMREAHEYLASGHTRGKVAITI